MYTLKTFRPFQHIWWVAMPIWFRRVLRLAVFVNVAGAVTFFPLFTIGRRLLGLPITHSFYLYIVSIWILLFAGFFNWMLERNEANDALLLLSALGKLSFAVLIFVFIVLGQMGLLAGLAGLIDLALAALFIAFLRRER